MKSSWFALTATASVTTALASPHRHAHRHLHDQFKRTVTATSVIPGPTAYAYILDGQPISVDEVCAGIANNELKFQGIPPAGICGSSTDSGDSDASSSSLNIGAGFYGRSSTASTTTTTTATTTTATTTSTTTTTSSASAASSAAASSGVSGVSAPFPDGQLDCSTFPSAYGAVPLNYLGLGGWSGLQAVTFGQGAITNIVTGISGNTCVEGMMCSYACPPGYQKAQWPATQGATGQSVGGIQCKGGKLWLTNSAMSTSLCMQGAGGVQATNNAGGVVAICRTDYPGTESETIPVEIQAGGTQPLTNPDAANYYTWQGQSTSAQYYLNPIGVSAAQGCQWGTAGSNMGNFAPINLGVGHKDGKTWLSIFQNQPTTYTPYSGTVTLQGDLSAQCTYSNGQYCGATGCNSNGCTVAVNSGTATFVISN